MILITHAVVGGAIMKLLPHHPVTGLFLAFASHFALDAIPHWDYSHLLKSYDYNKKDPLKSVIYLNKNFLVDLAKMGLDGILGLIFSVIMFHPSFPWVALGAISAMLPDFLQFLYLQTRREPFLSLQRFHLWAHSKYEFEKLSFTGIVSQIVIIILAVII